MEAGLEHLSWAGGTLRHVDLLLVVVEAHTKSMVTAGRTHSLAVQLGIPRIAFVGNRAGAGDAGRLETFARTRGAQLVAVIPEDDGIRRADRIGRCPLDCVPEAEGVRAIERLAGLLEDGLAAGDAGTEGEEQASA